MTASRAFAAMVSPSAAPKGGLGSAPATSFSSSSHPFSSSSSSSTLEQLRSYIPFLSSPPPSSSSYSSTTTSRSTSPTSSRSSSSSSCSTQTCLSYCCHSASSPTNTTTSGPAPTLNLRPKNYYSKRQRFMSNSHRAHSPLHSSGASSASHSDSGSDRDEDRDTAQPLQEEQQQHSLQKRAPHTTLSRTANTHSIVPNSGTPSYLSSAVSHSSETTMTTMPKTIPGNNHSNNRSTRLVADNGGNNSSNTAGTGPYLFVLDMPLSLYYPIRAMILFVLGFVFSLVIDHLQNQHQLVEYHPVGNGSSSSNKNSGNSGSNGNRGVGHMLLWDTASWLPPTCGASAVLIGTIYPLGDYLWWGRRVQRNGRDWSSVMRCLGGFIGVNYAASKLPWTSSLQVSCTLALISAALWFLFDRTFHGFVISLTVASMGTTVAYFLVLNGWYSFTRADFFGVGSWIPCILYSSSVCFGSIGRQLDVVPEAWYHSNGTCGRGHLKSE